MSNQTFLASRLSLAPMLDMTDRHFRYLCRLLSKRILLYTELTVTGAVLHGRDDLVAYNEEEHPVALQLGGNDPKELALCAQKAQSLGYDEVNLNVGCPSDRVQNGSFGAILMKNTALVCEAVAAMKDAVSIPVTVKTRLGVDDLNSYAYIHDFLADLQKVGTDAVILHARQAFLTGMSPRENRDKPPLNYERVYSLKKDFQTLNISINGNINTLAEALGHLEHVDGVMMGRALYQNPYMLAEADHLIYGEEALNTMSRKDLVRAMYPYIEKHLAAGGYLKHISRHLLGIFAGMPNARAYRQYISTHHHLEGAGIETLEAALSLVEDC